jgi:hypothetical protein
MIAIARQQIYRSTALEETVTVQLTPASTAGRSIVVAVHVANSSQRLTEPVVTGFAKIVAQSSGSLDAGGWDDSLWVLHNAPATSTIGVSIPAGYLGMFSIAVFELTGSSSAAATTNVSYNTGFTTTVLLDIATSAGARSSGGLLVHVGGSPNGNPNAFTPTSGQTEVLDDLLTDGYNGFVVTKLLPTPAASESSNLSILNASRSSSAGAIIEAEAPPPPLSGALFFGGD